MDLSPKLLTDVQFREQWRGYNPDEVDEFLERVAAGVDELQHRLNEAMERASAAERRLLERSDEDEIRRTLVLAQRTAVASMEEARTEADRLVSETESRCRQLVAEAEAQASRLDADIATRRRVELGDLAEQRAALQLDVDHLAAFLEGEKERLGVVLRSQIEWLERGYSLAELPAVSDVLAPDAPPPAPVVEPAFVAPVEAAPVVEPVDAFDDHDADVDDAPSDDAVAGSAVDELRLAREELADALRRAGVDTERDDDVAFGGEVVPEDVPLQLEPQRPGAPYDGGADVTGQFDVLADEPAAPVADAEPDDQPLWRDESSGESSTEDDDDPFLAELRRAVVDTEPLGPREDDHDLPDVDLGDDSEPSGGFFRRGKRKP
jgi:cell division initiation protein